MYIYDYPSNHHDLYKPTNRLILITLDILNNPSNPKYNPKEYDKIALIIFITLSVCKFIFKPVCVFRQKAAEKKRAEDARLACEAAEKEARSIALFVTSSPRSIALSLSVCVCECVCFYVSL